MGEGAGIKEDGEEGESEKSLKTGGASDEKASPLQSSLRCSSFVDDGTAADAECRRKIGIGAEDAAAEASTAAVEPRSPRR